MCNVELDSGGDHDSVQGKRLRCRQERCGSIYAVFLLAASIIIATIKPYEHADIINTGLATSIVIGETADVKMLLRLSERWILSAAQLGI